MADTTFVNGQTPVLAEWLNDVNDFIYNTFPALDVYANNADAIAGGLVAGNLYRTATGQVMVVY